MLSHLIKVSCCNNVGALCSFGPRYISSVSSGSEAHQEKKSDEVQLIRLDEENSLGIAVIALNRPQAKNAISVRFLQLFTEALDALKHDKAVRAVIVRSLVPGIFCAGADLKERAKMSPSEVGPFVSKLRAMVSGLHTLPIPVIAALDGAALGGGKSLSYSYYVYQFPVIFLIIFILWFSAALI